MDFCSLCGAGIASGYAHICANGNQCAACGIYVYAGTAHKCPVEAQQQLDFRSAVKLALMELVKDIGHVKGSQRFVIDIDDRGQLSGYFITMAGGVNALEIAKLPVIPDFVSSVIFSGLTGNATPWYIDTGEYPGVILCAVRKH